MSLSTYRSKRKCNAIFSVNNTYKVTKQCMKQIYKLKLQDAGNLDNTVIQCNCFNRNNGIAQLQLGLT